MYLFVFFCFFLARLNNQDDTWREYFNALTRFEARMNVLKEQGEEENNMLQRAEQVHQGNMNLVVDSEEWKQSLRKFATDEWKEEFEKNRWGFLKENISALSSSLVIASIVSATPLLFALGLPYMLLLRYVANAIATAGSNGADSVNEGNINSNVSENVVSMAAEIIDMDRVAEHLPLLRLNLPDEIINLYPELLS